MHKETIDFMAKVKTLFPGYFENKRVLDVGSQDINGTNNYLFENCLYLGMDLGQGKNVHIVSHVADYISYEEFDTIVSTNAFEHDARYDESMIAITTSLLKPNGLFAFSCASTGFQEHGTTATSPGDSPFTNDYYKNLTEADIREAIDIDEYFFLYEFSVVNSDLQFWGVKK